MRDLEKAQAAIRALLEHLPAMWGDEVIEGELTLRVEASAVYEAQEALALPKPYTPRERALAGWIDPATVPAKAVSK